MKTTRRWLAAMLLAALSAAASGCGSCDVERDVLYRYGTSGKNILRDIPAPTTAGGKARLEAFSEACDEAIKYGKK